MYDRKLLSVFTVLALLSGCAVMTGHPQTAEDFRQAVPDAMTAKYESFEVNRPFADVAATFSTKAPECLDVTIRTTSKTNMSYQVIVTDYNPTVRVSDSRAELHMQMHHEAGVLNVTKEPPGGYYMLVADASPVGDQMTRIDLYRPAYGYSLLTKTIKAWADGSNTGCPDMAKL
jgi:hypothetical protein